MRRTVQIAGQVQTFFGTLDENLKLFESALNITTHLHDKELAIEGEQSQVEKAVRILDQYNDLVRQGRRIENGAVKDLIRVATSDPSTTLKGILDPGAPPKPRQFGKKPVTPRSPNQRRYMEEIERND